MFHVKHLAVSRTAEQHQLRGDGTVGLTQATMADGATRELDRDVKGRKHSHGTARHGPQCRGADISGIMSGRPRVASDGSRIVAGVRGPTLSTKRCRLFSIPQRRGGGHPSVRALHRATQRELHPGQLRLVSPFVQRPGRVVANTRNSRRRPSPSARHDSHSPGTPAWPASRAAPTPARTRPPAGAICAVVSRETCA